MFCNRCGKQNLENSKFCTNCGARLGEEVVENANINYNGSIQKTINTANNMFVSNNQNFNNFNMSYNDIDKSIIRKSIKLTARSTPKSPIILTLIILILLMLLYPILININIGIGLLYSVLLCIFYFLIFFGITKSSIDISRGNNIKFESIMKNSFQKPSWFLKYILGLLLFVSAYIILVIVIGILPIINILSPILLIILCIYFAPVMSVYMHLAADKNVSDKSVFEMINSSMNLIKGHRVEFYGLVISFFGWYLLCIVTFSIAMFWVLPYLNLSLANFYLYLTGEKKYNNAEKGLSNIVIIILAIISYVITFVIIIIITLIFLQNIKSDLNNDYNNYNNQIEEFYNY